MSILKSFATLVVLISICNLIFIHAKLPNEDLEQFTALDMHKLIRISAPVLFPKNNYYVFTAYQWDPITGKSKTNIKRGTINGDEVIDLTEEKLGRSESNLVFTEDLENTYLLFIRTENGKSDIYYMIFDPSMSEVPEAKKLTDYPINVANLKTDGNYLVFSADVFIECGDNLQCTADKLKEIQSRGENTYQKYTMLMVRHWDFWYTEGSTTQPFIQKIKEDAKNKELSLDGEVVNVLNGKAIMSPPIENGSEQFALKGNRFVFSVLKRDKNMAWNTVWEIYDYDIEKNETIVLTSQDNNTEVGKCQNPKISPDGSKVAYLCMNRQGLESDQLHLRVVTKEKEEITVIKPKECEKEFKPAINDYIWYNSSDDMNIFILSVIENGHSRLYTYDFNLEEYENAFRALTKETDTNYYGTPSLIYEESNSDSYSLIVGMSSWTFPEVVAVLTIDGDETTVKIVANLNKAILEKFELKDGKSFTFEGAEKHEIQGWIFEPINFKKDTKYPLAFLIHGGPEGSWSPAWSYRWNPQLWANHGYAVVLINPHGSSGMGIEFQDGVRNSWGGVPYEDLMKGWEYLNNTEEFNQWIDMTKVGACGASYGGYMVNWIQGHNDDKKFKCLVTHDGVFSTVTMFYATEELWFPLAEYCELDKIGCKPYEDESREGYEKYSPEMMVDHWNTPHLIIHGSKDYRIPITEGISAFTALQLRGVPSRFLHFPDENHWVLKAENSIKWYDEVLAWLDKYLEWN